MMSKAEAKFRELAAKPKKTDEDVIEWERVEAEFMKELMEEQKDLIANLKAVGIEVKAVWDLVNTKENYLAAIPVLLEHVQKPYHPSIKESIIRALGVKEARGKATPLLIAEYYKIPKETMRDLNMRWAVGNAVYSTVTSADVDSIIPIVLDKENGFSRERFILALGKTKSGKAENVLISLLNDADDKIAAHAITALGLMKSKKALNKIGLVLESPKSSQLMKNEAVRAIRKIEGIKKL